ncbi:MAG: response regulator transcription factor [Alphaproteobacteria bacterium]|nr:response regulator transcription factor [Alphaproteobacteria bacterium]
MPNLHIVSDNTLFKDDLIFQIGQYAPDFNVVETDAIADIVIIDEKLEQISSYAVKYSHAPIFVLLKKGSEMPEQKNLIKYVQKPFCLAKFINQLNSAINLAAGTQSGKLQFNQYELSPTGKEILNFRNNEVIKLTEKEVSILQYLYKIKDRIVSKAELLQEVWGYNPDVTTHTIETHIYRLRQKVENEDNTSQLIITEEGGYILKR